MSESSMMEFDARTLKANVLVDPGWYQVFVESIAPPEVSSKGDSFNHKVSLTIIKNDDSGDETFKDVPLITNFNTKAMGIALSFLQTLGVEVNEPGRVDLNAAKGMTTACFVGNKVYEERMRNNVEAKWRKPRAA